MEIIGALIAGTFIGSVLGFVGAGGAMLAVPILIYGFGFEPSVASTAALAVVSFINSQKISLRLVFHSLLSLQG